MSPRRFKIRIDDAHLHDLDTRLRTTRWPSALMPEGWGDGTSLAFMQELVHYWIDEFDWRAVEARLNRLENYMVRVDGIDLHFVHHRGVGPAPFPLVITHGWPGSFAEMERIIPLLTDPAAHGGNAEDAFDLVVPSLPGYGFSSAPARPGVGAYEISALWIELMKKLGYGRFGAQGGDMGAAVTAWLAFRFPEQVAGIHLNLIPGIFTPFTGSASVPLSAEEQRFIDARKAWQEREGAYAHLHRTKPQTLAYALTDSPAGLAAWVVEKFRAWSDCGGDVTSIFSKDTLLTEIALYWFHGSLESSMRLYKETSARSMSFSQGQRLEPPVGVAHFAKETPMPPRSWVERAANVTRWTTFERGGHFAAMEQPLALAEDIRAHFRAIRGMRT